jgi:hypothetical protein
VNVPVRPSRPRLRGYTRLEAGVVDSVQALELPPGVATGLGNLAALERLYFSWVPRLTSDLVRTAPATDAGWEGELQTRPTPTGWPLVMSLGPPVGGPNLRRRAILGGWLAESSGSFAIERRGDALIVAVHDFRPKMPLSLYERFQVPLHDRVSYAFLRQIKTSPPGSVRVR